MDNRLAAKVKAVNRANEYAITLYETLAAVFQPLVGQPILKADGSLLKKVEKLVPAFPYNNDIRVCRLTSGYSLAYMVKTCEDIQGTGTCLYHETCVYVGTLDGATLKELYPAPNTSPTYTVEAIQEARRRYEAAKKVADDARNALFPFGEYDH